jgi:predicted metalloprotease
MNEIDRRCRSALRVFRHGRFPRASDGDHVVARPVRVAPAGTRRHRAYEHCACRLYDQRNVARLGNNDHFGLPAAPAEPGLPTPSTTPEVNAFISAVFTDAQTDWQRVFAAADVPYTPARLVLFSSAVRSGCGPQSSEVGPFYCPADHTVYLDVLFFDEMERRYGVTGDFAMAYVVAHEIGHHIQAITGLSSQVAQQQQADPAQANALSIRTELQADCYAGVWAHSTYQRGLLEPGDLDEALTAAATVGDDFLQQSAGGSIAPEQWTHGSSAQRQQWLTTGYESGQPSACNTFAG